MARRFLTNIDLNNNEIQNVVIHVLATAPATPSEGQIYYNSTTSKIMLRQAALWVDITGRINDVVATTGAVVITEAVDGVKSIAILDATQSASGLMSAIDKLKLDNATAAATADTLALRDSNGDISFNNMTVTEEVIINKAIDGTTSANAAVTKSYVDNLVTSGLKFLGTIDCSVNPDYPAAVEGDAYVAQPGGLIGGALGEAVNQGDWIVCIADNAGGDEATVGSDWSVVETNITDATETVSGKVRVATQAEVNAGVLDGAVSISPLKLQQKLNSLPLGAAAFSEDIGDGSSTAYVIAHNLNSIDVQYQLRENSTGDVMEADFQSSDANNGLVTFNVAPTASQYRITILG
ncbi:MAG: hypothetical protein DRQ39_08495 [Gammaproteobacteria bacterium]|nr:MAG: hypothetical protein DRQ39_08495 [Gammaproteobacteria bacterium]